MILIEKQLIGSQLFLEQKGSVTGEHHCSQVIAVRLITPALGVTTAHITERGNKVDIRIFRRRRSPVLKFS